MQRDFLGKLFDILVFPKESQQKFRQYFGEIIIYNLADTVLRTLPPEKKESLGKLLKSGKVEQESLERWTKENGLGEDKEFLKEVNGSLEKSMRDYFLTLTKDLNETKRQEVINFANSFII